MCMAEGSDGLGGKTDDKDFGEDVDATVSGRGLYDGGGDVYVEETLSLSNGDKNRYDVSDTDVTLDDDDNDDDNADIGSNVDIDTECWNDIGCVNRW